MKTLKQMMTTILTLGVLATIAIPGQATTNWGEWQSRGGYSNSQPIAVAQNGAVKVFTIGSNSRLQYFNSATGQWQTLLNSPSCFGRPAVVVRGSGMDAFVYGWDSTLYHARLESNGAVAWESLGSASWIQQAPAAVSTSPDNLDVFMVGTDGNLHRRSFAPPSSGGGIGDDPPVWGNWVNLGHAPNSPALCSYPAAGTASGQIHVVAISIYGRLQHWSSSSGWVDHGYGGALLYDNPAICVVNSSSLLVSARGSDNRLWIRAYSTVHGTHQWPYPFWGNWIQTGVRASYGAGPAIAYDGRNFKLFSMFTFTSSGDGAGDDPPYTMPYGMETGFDSTEFQNALSFPCDNGLLYQLTPAVVAINNGQTNVYIIGRDGALWEKQIISP